MKISTIYIDPVSKPRMTQRDKWRKRPCVIKYRAYCDDLRAWMKENKAEVDFNRLRVYFFIKMPDSWSKKKKKEMNYTAHKQKPDIDNLLKAFMDALLKDDSGVHDVGMSKTWYWGDTGYIKFNVL